MTRTHRRVARPPAAWPAAEHFPGLTGCAELDVDFDSHVLSGYVEHTVTVKSDGAGELALDTSDVTVSSITVNGKGMAGATWHPIKEPTFKEPLLHEHDSHDQ